MVDLCRRQHQELDLTWPEVVTPSAAPPCTFRRVAEMPLQSAQARASAVRQRSALGGVLRVWCDPLARGYCSPNWFYFLGPHHGLMSKHRICCAPRGSRGSTGSRAEIGVDAVVSRAPLAGACGRLTEPVRSLEGRMRKRCPCHLNQLAKRLAQQELVGCAAGRIEHSGLARLLAAP